MAQKIATRESYGNALAALGEKYDFVVLDADLAAATKTGIFKKKFPERFFDCGIAEGNMMSVAAGLAAAGKVPFASTFAMFAASSTLFALLIAFLVASRRAKSSRYILSRFSPLRLWKNFGMIPRAPVIMGTPVPIAKIHHFVESA